MRGELGVKKHTISYKCTGSACDGEIKLEVKAGKVILSQPCKCQRAVAQFNQKEDLLDHDFVHDYAAVPSIILGKKVTPIVYVKEKAMQQALLFLNTVQLLPVVYVKDAVCKFHETDDPTIATKNGQMNKLYDIGLADGNLYQINIRMKNDNGMIFAKIHTITGPHMRCPYSSEILVETARTLDSEISKIRSAGGYRRDFLAEEVRNLEIDDSNTICLICEGKDGIYVSEGCECTEGAYCFTCIHIYANIWKKGRKGSRKKGRNHGFQCPTCRVKSARVMVKSSLAQQIKGPLLHAAMNGRTEVPRIYGWHHDRMMPTNEDYDLYEPVFKALVQPTWEIVASHQHNIEQQTANIQMHLKDQVDIEAKIEALRVNNNNPDVFEIPEDLSEQLETIVGMLNICKDIKDVHEEEMAVEKNKIPAWAINSAVLSPGDDPAVPLPDSQEVREALIAIQATAQLAAANANNQ